MPTTYPFTVDVTINVDSLANEQVRQAITLMVEAGLPVDELIEAFINGLSPTYYAQSRTEFGHSHKAITDNPLLISIEYLNLRRKQGCTKAQALQVLAFGCGSTGREIYRVCRKADWDHKTALKAMEMAQLDDSMRRQDRLQFRRQAGTKPVNLIEFVRKALRAKETDPNEIWRGYLAYYSIDPFDLGAEAA